MSVSEEQFDVAVLGGGPAGAVTALQTARLGLRVTVIDRGFPEGEKVGETIAPSAQALFERLGLMAGFLADGHLPCYANRSVWGRDDLEERHFINDIYGHGWHLDRKRFDRFLLKAVEDAGAVIRSRTSAKAFEPLGAGWLLRLADKDGRETAVSARWVVDATGRAGWFARRLGVARRVDDKLVGVAGFLGTTTEQFEDTTTLVEATPDGWWYSALLPDGRLVAVYFTDADLVEGTGGTHSGFWRERLSGARMTTDRIERHGGALPSEVRIVSAASSRLETMAGSNWLAVGDAAASYDPLSSCGIVTAMAGGMEGAAAIQERISGDEGATDRYSEHMRQSYERYRLMLAAYYRDETRWASRPFWKRRSGERVVIAA